VECRSTVALLTIDEQITNAKAGFRSFRRVKDEAKSYLEELLREGARKLLQTAIARVIR
jgi:hypothetical protein